FAEYFPHLHLGDRSCDQFLQEFKFQKDEYDQKILDLLFQDAEFQNGISKKVTLHQLWSGSEAIEASTIKYKLMDPMDKTFVSALEKGCRVRLDGNGLFTHDLFLAFINEIPSDFLSNIDYIEDP